MSKENNSTKTLIYPEIQFPNVTDLDLKLAAYYFPILVEVAQSSDRITYGDLLKRARERYPNYFNAEPGKQRETDFSTGRRLGTIWRFTQKFEYPLISALVVNASTGECGHGLLDSVDDPDKERQRVWDFDWDSVSDDFMAHLGYERAKKEEQVSKRKKRKKRSSTEAARLLGEYWKETSDQWPKDIRNHREEIQKTIQSGVDPAVAFGSWTLIHRSSHKTEQFVYLAVYRNAITQKPIPEMAQYLKIGCTSDLKARAKTLSGGVKAPVEVIITHAWQVKTGNAFAVEQLLHGYFGEQREIGEWFNHLEGALPELIQEQLEHDPLTCDIVVRSTEESVGLSDAI